MPVTLDATVGGASANSYVAVAAADEYLGAHPFAAAWRALGASGDDLDTKHRALIHATRQLDALRYVGDMSTTTQALQWPRRYVPDPRRRDAVGDPVASSPFTVGGPMALVDSDLWLPADAIPARITEATCELALILVAAGTTDPLALPGASSAASTANVKREVVGPLETEYFAPAEMTGPAAAVGLARYPNVLALLRGFVVSGTRVVRA